MSEIFRTFALANIQINYQTTKFLSNKMQFFLEKTGLTVFEEKCFKARAISKLEWSETVWWNKINGRTALTAAERIVMEQELSTLRAEVAAGTLDLRAYNK